jgi:hypothetical protein
MIRSWGLMSAVNAAKLSSVQSKGTTRMDSLGGGSRVGLDVDTPDLGVEVEGLQSSVSAEVLEDINVLYISSDRYI